MKVDIINQIGKKGRAAIKLPYYLANRIYNNIFYRVASEILQFIRNGLISVRLRPKLEACSTFLSSPDRIMEIRERTLNYLESMRLKDGNYGRYKYAGGQTEPVLYASLYAALVRHLYGDVNGISEQQRKEWISYILSHQTDDGLFKDPLIANNIAPIADWWGWRHLTLHAIMGLNALGTVAEKEFRFLEPFKKRRFVIDWLESRSWTSSPADVSNEIQNHAALLQYARDFHGKEWAGDTIEEILDWLDGRQDPETGLWGNRFDIPHLLSMGVQTGYHLWLIYFYDRRPLKYVDRIIESILKSQNSLGGFGVSLNSSACEDIDSIDPLVRLYFHTDYRRSDIIKALEKALHWVLVNMNDDGGFVFSRMASFKYGHEKMYSAAEESAMFPTWFRTLSLAFMGQVLTNSIAGKYDWQFLRCPGHQFWIDGYTQ